MQVISVLSESSCNCNLLSVLIKVMVSKLSHVWQWYGSGLFSTVSSHGVKDLMRRGRVWGDSFKMTKFTNKQRCCIMFIYQLVVNAFSQKEISCTRDGHDPAIPPLGSPMVASVNSTWKNFDLNTSI